MNLDWMRGPYDEFLDIHSVLRPFDAVVRFFELVETDSGVLNYCNGGNASGRWIFQIYTNEFIQELAGLIDKILQSSDSHGPVLEVMCGDGKLVEFISPLLSREILATDSKTDSHDIAYPKWVIEIDALEAIEKYIPSIILACWEPFFSTVSEQIVKTNIPFVWIGDTRKCAPHSDILKHNHVKLNCSFALGRYDSFIEKRFHTDIYVFNHPNL
ncbi:MAG: hypothetical protein RTU30_15065 [Candidatus Thorarchaeota archaeon]